jgi:predicted amidophosphoribosyltransferase
MEWECVGWKKHIKVYYGNYYKGCYIFLQEPYCKICAHPDVKTEFCQDHYDLHGFERICAMGKYVKNQSKIKNSLLSHHIRTLKKYPTHASPLGRGLEIAVSQLYPELLDSAMIVPVPQHPDKLKERRFNQALELSEVVGERLHMPVKNVLVKIKNMDLRKLGRKERLLAVEDMYAHGKDCSKIVNGKNIIIIDDVVTTGSTASKCAKLLKEAGAKKINVLVAGRTV